MPDAHGPRPLRHIEALAPYQLADLTGMEGRKPVLLSQNENAARPSELAIRAALDAVQEANRYPEGDAATLRNAIGWAEGVPADRIICANGSMELIALLAQCYLGPEDEAVVSEYGYLFFRSAVQAVGARPVIAPEAGLRSDIEAMLRAVGPKTRLMFLANPNNPTGSLLSGDEVRRLRAALRSDVILVLDGAYSEYVEDPAYDAGAELVSSTANTAMLRTFSKIHGLAGLRVGWGYFPPGIADILNRVRLPNAISAPAIAGAAAAIADREHVAGLRRDNLAFRTWFEGELRALGLLVHASNGNFSLVSFASPDEARETDAFLRARNIFVRPMAGYGLAHCLRVTIGAREELAAVLAALRERKPR